MKKAISVFLAILMLLTTTTAVFAKSSSKSANKKVPYGISKKLFSDSDDVKWAQKAIERLKLKNLVLGVDGKYLPKKSVTKIEAIIMALRIMGWENEALAIKELPKNYKGEAVNKWAVGYVAEAAKKCLLDEVDLMYFKPTAPVKRHEVAKYIIRALGKDAEAKSNMTKQLPFVDAAAVPQGSVGYVYLINELGIMTGDGKTFNPMGTLSRAEMAVLFNNLDNKVDSNIDVNEYKGNVKSISASSITLKIRSSVKSFSVSSEVTAYKGTTKINYSDIKVDSRVQIKVENGKVVYIEVIGDEEEDKIISQYTGNVVTIVNTAPMSITVQIEEMKAIFNVIDTVEVYFNGVKGNISEIKVGDVVTVTVDDKKRATRIDVKRQREAIEVQGTLTAIGWTGEYYITIADKKYNLSSTAKVKINDTDAKLQDLIIGMNVKIVLENDIATSIDAHDNKTTVNGGINAIISSADGYKLELKVNNTTNVYVVSQTAKIEIINMTTPQITDVKSGMIGDFEITNSTITGIKITG